VRRLALPGALLAAPIAAIGSPGLGLGCPILAITGLPCPTCGGTRAVHLMFEGDPDLLRYNPVWAIAVGVAWALAALVAWRRLRGRAAIGPRLRPAFAWLRARPAAIAALAAGLAAAGWVTAMLNLEAIRAG
jgi:hypothetical protein